MTRTIQLAFYLEGDQRLACLHFKKKPRIFEKNGFSFQIKQEITTTS